MSEIKTWRGIRACDCMVQTLPKVEAEMIAKGIIKHNIDIFQGGYNRGGVRASAGTHDGGGVIDTGQYSDAALRVWRSWGWITWHRTPAQGFSHHAHGVLHDCPHQSGGAQAQVNAYFNGRNGLANNRADDGPRGLVVDWRKRIKQGVPTAPKVAQRLGDFWNPWPEITSGAGKNPHKVVLYGISDADLKANLLRLGFDADRWYQGNLAWTLADFARSVASPISGIEMIRRLREDRPLPWVSWVDHLQQREAARNASGIGGDKQLSLHSVRALQSGLTNLGYPTLVDGIYGRATRASMVKFQIGHRGARAGTPAADGTPGANDAMHLGFASDPKPGGVRTRHTY